MAKRKRVKKKNGIAKFLRSPEGPKAKVERRHPRCCMCRKCQYPFKREEWQ